MIYMKKTCGCWKAHNFARGCSEMGAPPSGDVDDFYPRCSYGKSHLNSREHHHVQVPPLWNFRLGDPRLHTPGRLLTTAFVEFVFSLSVASLGITISWPFLPRWYCWWLRNLASSSCGFTWMCLKVQVHHKIHGFPKHFPLNLAILPKFGRRSFVLTLLDSYTSAGKTSESKTRHQEFQVPKMEVLNLIFGYFWGVGFPVSISRIHTAYIGQDSTILAHRPDRSSRKWSVRSPSDDPLVNEHS